MRPAEERLVSLLRQFASDLFDASTDAEGDSRFEEVLRATDAVESPQDRFEILTTFVHQLLGRALEDSLAMRLAVLARVAVRIQNCVDSALATRVALMLAGKLESLDDASDALNLITPRIDAWDQDSGDASEWRAASAMRLRLLVNLKEFERGDQIADAYELDERRGADAFELDVLVSGARCASMANRPDVAVRRAMQAVERHQRGDAERRGNSFLNLIAPPIPASRIYRTAGESLRQASLPLEAINVFQLGRKQALRESNAAAAALYLSEVGITWELLGEADRGAAFLEQAAMEAERLGDLQSAARWRKQPVVGDDGALDLRSFNGLAAIGHAIRNGTPTEEHERIIKQLVKEAREDGTQLEPIARSLLAALYAHRGQTGLALLAIRAAIESAERLQARWHALSLRSHEARFLFNAGRWREALPLADQVLAESQWLWNKASSSEVRQTAVAAASVAAEIILVISSGEATNSNGETWRRDPDLARRVSHRTRARGFNRWLALADWSRGLEMPEVESAMRSLICADLAVEWAAQEGQPMSLVLQRRDRADQSFAVAVERAGARPPETEDPSYDRELNLPPGAMAIDLGAVESGVVGLFAERGGQQRVLHIPWQRPQRSAWRERWRIAWNAEVQRLGLQRGDLRSPALPHCEQQQADTVAAPTLDALYEELDSVLIRPLNDAIGVGIERLIASVHAELFFIPLWALARHRPSLEISLVPSLDTIGLLASRPSPFDGPSIAIGDATGTLAMVARECELMTGFHRVAPAIEKVAAAVPTARRIHFAGHGEFDNDNPYLSGLILRALHQPPNVVATGVPGCGRVTISGIFDRLDTRNCDLATISACSVGAPRDHAASEFTSVPTALILAGARNVVAANWHVHDAATTVQMAHLNVELQRTKSIAAALAASRRRLAATTFAEAARILGRQDVLPAGERPFASPLFTDAMVHFGVG